MTKRKRGRPVAGGKTPMVGLRLNPVVTSKVDAYAEKHGHHTRSDAIRELLERALACAEAT